MLTRLNNRLVKATIEGDCVKEAHISEAYYTDTRQELSIAEIRALTDQLGGRLYEEYEEQKQDQADYYYELYREG